MRLPLQQVTLVAIDTDLPILATEALLRCMERIEFGRVLLFTHGFVPRCVVPGLQVVDIDPLPDAGARSHFLLRVLPPYVRSSHALIVQWDAFVADAAMWTDEFLLHDYIGAPWADRPEDVAVGTGAFSLRSRRMLQAGQDRRILELHPEDEVLCRVHRERLQREHGVSFAPPALARRFAVGAAGGSARSFGFDGAQHLPRALDEKSLRAWFDLMPDAFFGTDTARRLARALLRHRMPGAARQLLDRRGAAGLPEADTRWLDTATSIMGLLSPRA